MEMIQSQSRGRRGGGRQRAPGGSHVGRLLRVVINDGIVDITCQAVIFRLKELVIAGVLDQGRGPQAVSMPLPCHITHHQAAAIGRPVAIHQLDVVCPAGVHVWPGVLRGEAASNRCFGWKQVGGEAASKRCLGLRSCKQDVSRVKARDVLDGRAGSRRGETHT